MRRQEEEFAKIKELKDVLISEKHILKEAELEVDLETRHYLGDVDCQRASFKPGIAYFAEISQNSARVLLDVSKVSEKFRFLFKAARVQSIRAYRFRPTLR